MMSFIIGGSAVTLCRSDKVLFGTISLLYLHGSGHAMSSSELLEAKFLLASKCCKEGLYQFCRARRARTTVIVAGQRRQFMVRSRKLLLALFGQAFFADLLSLNVSVPCLNQKTLFQKASGRFLSWAFSCQTLGLHFKASHQIARYNSCNSCVQHPGLTASSS